MNECVHMLKYLLAKKQHRYYGRGLQLLSFKESGNKLFTDYVQMVNQP